MEPVLVQLCWRHKGAWGDEHGLPQDWYRGVQLRPWLAVSETMKTGLLRGRSTVDKRELLQSGEFLCHFWISGFFLAILLTIKVSPSLGAISMQSYTILNHPFLWSEGQSVSRSQCSWSYLGCPIINFCLRWKERKKCHFVHLSRAYVLSHAQGSFRSMKFAQLGCYKTRIMGGKPTFHTYFLILEFKYKPLPSDTWLQQLLFPALDFCSVTSFHTWFWCSQHMNLTTVSPHYAPFSWLPTPLCSEDSFLFCAGVLHTR